MYTKIKERVLIGNKLLPKHELVIFTWGNVSEYDKENNIIAIKPSGVSYDKMKVDDIVIVGLDGTIIEGDLNPSSDLDTHLEIYRNYPSIKSIVHVHSRWATIFAQQKMNIPTFGTTHGDYFYGDILCTREMTDEEISDNYELNTGKVIVETFKENKLSPLEVPAVLVASHAPFIFGTTAKNAVENSVVLEEIAMMAWHNLALNKDNNPMSQRLLDKHYLRKHGQDAYYGQKK